jgi:hypothetical protein
MTEPTFPTIIFRNNIFRKGLKRATLDDYFVLNLIWAADPRLAYGSLRHRSVQRLSVVEELTHFVSVYGWWQRVYELHLLVDACHASLLVHFARTPAATSHTLVRGGPHYSLGAQLTPEKAKTIKAYKLLQLAVI